MDLGIEGKVALVTGGARSLGKQDCLTLAVEGCKVIVLDMKGEDWDLNLRINLTGTYNVTKAVFPGMRERKWGRVICMASIAGLLGGFGQTAYATGKMGVVGFAKSVALEGARSNVTANVIAPGIIGPNANLSPLYDRMVKRVAMQKEGQREDIANAIAFLCSERARYITVDVLTITGGMDLFTF